VKNKLAILLYKIRNWKAVWRAFYMGAYITLDTQLAKLLRVDTGGTARAYGTLGAVLIRADGTRLDFGCVARRVVTTAFVNYLRDDMANAAGGADISTFKYHECGTGVAAETIADTALGTPCTTALNPASTRATGTQVNGTAKTYQSVGTLTFGSTAAVTEHGIFNALTTGVLLDRSVFAAINAAALDSIQFTYTLTIADGG
jgi:hypothetical protein